MKRVFLILMTIAVVLGGLSLYSCDETPADEQPVADDPTETPDTTTPPADEPEEIPFTGLKGLTINAIGDSYFAGEGLSKDEVWLGLLAEKYDINMNNYGVGGSTISDLVNQNPMCKRYSQMPDNSPDIVILEGGRNDYMSKVPLGTVTSKDTKTFMGAINVTIDGLQAKYPNAMIVCITNWNFNNTSTHDSPYGGSAVYANAMKQVADAQGVYCIMANDPNVSGVDVSNADFRAQYCIKPGDVSHLNADGMKLVMPKFDAVLTEYYKDFLNKK
ncbi:MAG: SGNH/GDSL hydrolase family protein [Ruminococcaceae bacterium]|nr:SGNH/GDSL hydrolase family protein [Oscillospiraceae bacterium]